MPKCATLPRTNLEAAFSNRAFRRVLTTWKRTQAVAMSLRPGQDIGAERHRKVEQVFLVVAGDGVATIDGRHLEIGMGSVFAACPGRKHNVRAGREGLKLLTFYTPPNHLEGRVHLTKADAEADLEDEAFGQKVGG
jgi:mannose-6-phosphate isomerase-like protein (cupin superfamily)